MVNVRVNVLITNPQHTKLLAPPTLTEFSKHAARRYTMSNDLMSSLSFVPDGVIDPELFYKN